jgi:hypothetical protein
MVVAVHPFWLCDPSCYLAWHSLQAVGVRLKLEAAAGTKLKQGNWTPRISDELLDAVTGPTRKPSASPHQRRRAIRRLANHGTTGWPAGRARLPDVPAWQYE